MTGKLILEDNTTIEGVSFGANISTAGEVVFSTGMVGYPESLTDPSYKGQILILTYPIVGNYGVPQKKYWESDSIQISGLIVSSYTPTPSHFQKEKTLDAWFKEENLPLLEISDTRLLTQKLRSNGTMVGKIIFDNEIEFYNPDKENLVEKVSTKELITQGRGPKTILLLDCGTKKNIEKCLIERGIKVIT
ncbi:carbamoyl-phosphate synthase (glutamine-hydrolyzing) small subunit, partial [Patescibacteria group bacterium]|nr:carbamoyl-phosphate synthase (glutamine-hydrolyzing) small subunit [Patescibacteria group bacterium]